MWTLFSVNIPDGAVSLVIQESPAVGNRQRRAVGDGDFSLSLCVVEHTAKIHCGGGEVEVGEMDLSM